MAERYQIISHNDNRMYQNDCPVICCAYNILLDTVTDDLLLQIKFDNLNTIPVKELTLSVDCFDVSGLLLSSDFEFNYIVNDGSYRKTFGSDNAKNLPNNKTRKIFFKVKSIAFENGDIWNNTNNSKMELVPRQRSISEYLKSAELVSEFEKQTSNIYKKRLEPTFENKYWLCSCGEINLNDTNKCHTCDTEKSHLSHIYNISVLKNIIDNNKNKTYLKAVEYFNKNDYIHAKKHFELISDWKDSKTYIEKCTKMAKSKSQSKMKTLLLLIVIAVPVCLFGFKYFEKSSSYKEAASLIKSNNYNYQEVYCLLEKRDGYKNAESLRTECVLSWVDYIIESKKVAEKDTFIVEVELTQGQYEQCLQFIKDGLSSLNITYYGDHERALDVYIEFLTKLPQDYDDARKVLSAAKSLNSIRSSSKLDELKNHVKEITYFWDFEQVKDAVNNAKWSVWMLDDNLDVSYNTTFSEWAGSISFDNN